MGGAGDEDAAAPDPAGGVGAGAVAGAEAEAEFGDEAEEADEPGWLACAPPAEPDAAEPEAAGPTGGGARSPPSSEVRRAAMSACSALRWAVRSADRRAASASGLIVLTRMRSMSPTPASRFNGT